jgi:uncharacterized membrane protein
MAHRRSKTLATWLALVGGAVGAHRLYLRGLGDRLAWLHPWPTLAGLYGVQRMQSLGQDDRLAWLLLPLLGLMVAQAAVAAIVYGLTPDERWDARWNASRASPASGWGAVLGVIAALLIGATVLLSSITFTLQRYFEAQVEAAHQISR